MEEIDSKWFADRLRDRGLSGRTLAKLLNSDPSTISLTLRGKRKMTIERANELAHHLQVPVAEVMRRAGVVVERHATGELSLPLVGWVDQDGKAEVDWQHAQRRAPVGTSLPPDTVVIQWRTSQTAADTYDGWMICVAPPRPPVADQMLGRYCVVGVGDGSAYVRSIRRGFDMNHFTLVGMHGQEPMYDQEVKWFAPVLLMIPN